jgi:hypothetical protein
LAKKLLLKYLKGIHGETFLRRKLILSSIVIFVLLIFSLVVLAEADSVMWYETYGGTRNDVASSLVETSDGGYAIIGYTESFGAIEYDFLLVKTDGYGHIEWNKTYGGAELDFGLAIVATSDGGYALAGQTQSFGAGNSDFWLIKTDGTGNVEWNRTYGGIGWEYANSLVATADGGYAMAGGTLLVKTDEFGNVDWNQTFPGEANSLVVTSDGGYALVGDIKIIPEGADPRLVPYDCWLAKTDAYGNVEWNQTYAEADDDRAWSLVETSDGGYAIGGSTSSFGAGGYDFWLIKTDIYGNVEWNQTYGGANEDFAHSLVKTSDGGYALTGYTKSFGAGDRDFWLIKTDGLGNIEWNQTYGGTVEDMANSMIATSDGGYAIAGGTYSFGVEGGNFWLLKSDEGGIIPECSSWIISSLLFIVIIFALFNKKRLLHGQSSKTEIG